MWLKHVLLLSLTLATGLLGSRCALIIRRAKGSKKDLMFMLVVCWSPLMVWFLALLATLSGSPS